MPKTDIKITVEVEPIVKLYCNAVECRFNLYNGSPNLNVCNLKYILLGETGKCKAYEPEPEDA